MKMFGVNNEDLKIFDKFSQMFNWTNDFIHNKSFIVQLIITAYVQPSWKLYFMASCSFLFITYISWIF